MSVKQFFVNTLAILAVLTAVWFGFFRATDWFSGPDQNRDAMNWASFYAGFITLVNAGIYISRRRETQDQVWLAYTANVRQDPMTTMITLFVAFVLPLLIMATWSPVFWGSMVAVAGAFAACVVTDIHVTSVCHA